MRHHSGPAPSAAHLFADARGRQAVWPLAVERRGAVGAAGGVGGARLPLGRAAAEAVVARLAGGAAVGGRLAPRLVVVDALRGGEGGVWCRARVSWGHAGQRPRPQRLRHSVAGGGQRRCILPRAPAPGRTCRPWRSTPSCKSPPCRSRWPRWCTQTCPSPRTAGRGQGGAAAAQHVPASGAAAHASKGTQGAQARSGGPAACAPTVLQRPLGAAS